MVPPIFLLTCIPTRKEKIKEEIKPIFEVTHSDFKGVFSGDGSHVAFTSDKDGHPSIWVQDTAGLKTVVKLRLDENLIVTNLLWNHDNGLIYFSGFQDCLQCQKYFPI